MTSATATALDLTIGNAKSLSQPAEIRDQAGGRTIHAGLEVGG